jgi:hypothetical protein
MSLGERVTKVAWTGTCLEAAFLATAQWWHDLPSIFAGWNDTGLLENGTGNWLELSPATVDYNAIMEGALSHTEAWEGGTDRLTKLSRELTLYDLFFPFEWAHGPGHLKLYVMVYEDNSVAVHLAAPYYDIYEDRDEHTARRNLRLFLEAACSLFVPDTFLFGYIGEEACNPTLDTVLAERQLPDDWAFYGSRLLRSLGWAAVAQHLPSAREIRGFSGSGLFVRWTDWTENTPTAASWKAELRRAAGMLS